MNDLRVFSPIVALRITLRGFKCVEKKSSTGAYFWEFDLTEESIRAAGDIYAELGKPTPSFIQERLDELG